MPVIENHTDGFGGSDRKGVSYSWESPANEYNILV